jgi:hypothetical protein
MHECVSGDNKYFVPGEIAVLFAVRDLCIYSEILNQHLLGVPCLFLLLFHHVDFTGVSDNQDGYV